MPEWLMVILTFVYVVATIIICYHNNKLIKSSQIGNKLISTQIELSQRAYVVIDIVIRQKALVCFFINNVGNSVAKNIKVNVNQDFKNTLEEYYTQNYKDSFQPKLYEIFLLETHYIVPKDKRYYPFLNLSDYKIIKDKELIIHVSYESNGRYYRDSFKFNLQEDFLLIDDLYELNKEMKTININLKSISETLKKQYNRCNTDSASGK